MVSIFDDDADEVGSEIEAYCPKCKADTTHVIISKYEDEIRRVQCNPCGDVHAFRKPRGEADEEPPEPISAKKRAAKVKPTWEQVMAKAKKQPRLYVVAEQYGDNELISHPKFGVGFVSEVIGLDKIEVTFQTEKRVLIHNRKGMSLPPAAYAHVVDATVQGIGGEKRKGAVKQAAAKAAAKSAGGKPAAPAASRPKAAATAKAAPVKPAARPKGAVKPAPTKGKVPEKVKEPEKARTAAAAQPKAAPKPKGKPPVAKAKPAAKSTAKGAPTPKVKAAQRRPITAKARPKAAKASRSVDKKKDKKKKKK